MIAVLDRRPSPPRRAAVAGWSPGGPAARPGPLARPLPAPARGAAAGPGGPVHLLLCIADHFEPKWGGASPEVARATGRGAGSRDYPRLFGGFRDSDGRPPRHTFFYPVEEYEPEYLDALAGLCRAGFGEVEVHLHHDGDTAENLRRTLLEFKDTLADRHGLLARDRGDRRAGLRLHPRQLGPGQLPARRPMVRRQRRARRPPRDRLLRRLHVALGPEPDARPATINSIYYAVDDPDRPKSHDRGVDVGAGPGAGRLADDDPGAAGPRLAAARSGASSPGVENGCLQGEPAGARSTGSTPGSRAGVQVPSPARLVLRQAPHPRRPGGEPGGPARRADGRVPPGPGRVGPRPTPTSTTIT